jgi:hypothetical protein
METLTDITTFERNLRGSPLEPYQAELLRCAIRALRCTKESFAVHLPHNEVAQRMFVDLLIDMEMVPEKMCLTYDNRSIANYERGLLARLGMPNMTEGGFKLDFPRKKATLFSCLSDTLSRFSLDLVKLVAGYCTFGTCEIIFSATSGPAYGSFDLCIANIHGRQESAVFTDMNKKATQIFMFLSVSSPTDDCIWPSLPLMSLSKSPNWYKDWDIQTRSSYCIFQQEEIRAISERLNEDQYDKEHEKRRAALKCSQL